MAKVPEIVIPVKIAVQTPDYLKPTVGRIVHYQPFHQVEPLAAIVTAAYDDGCVNLAIFNADGTTTPKPCARQAHEPTEGFWNWPAHS